MSAARVKATDLVVPEVKTAHNAVLDLAAFNSTATMISVQLDGTVSDRMDQVVWHGCRSMRHELASGLLLISVKGDCQHGEFGQLLESRGVDPRSARESMQLARFVISRPQAEREMLLGLQKSKVRLLLHADQELLEAVVDIGVERLSTLSVHAMQQELADLRSALKDAQMHRDMAENNVKGLSKRVIQFEQGERQDKVPMVVAMLRAEVTAMQKKASLVLDTLGVIGVDLVNLGGTQGASDWADSTLRLAIAAIDSIRLQADGVLQQYARALPGVGDQMTAYTYLSPQESEEAQKRWGQLTLTHKQEAAYRAQEREKQLPRKRGRPRNEIEPPIGGLA